VTKPAYLTIEQRLDILPEPNRSACLAILADHRALFQTVQGSTNNHQNWVGGYFDHVQEVMNIAAVEYERLDSLRPLSFELSDLLLVLYLHDIEKPWKYELHADGQLHHKPAFASKEDQQHFRLRKLAEYGILLTPEQENGIRYAEGELTDYSSRRRVMGPLAALAHVCDVLSARCWHDHPLIQDDPWVGAGRIRD
jgi:23S rRNA maturation-related 3'-5' exoribonuclease YhaM